MALRSIRDKGEARHGPDIFPNPSCNLSIIHPPPAIAKATTSAQCEESVRIDYLCTFFRQLIRTKYSYED